MTIGIYKPTGLRSAKDRILHLIPVSTCTEPVVLWDMFIPGGNVPYTVKIQRWKAKASVFSSFDIDLRSIVGMCLALHLLLVVLCWPWAPWVDLATRKKKLDTCLASGCLTTVNVCASSNAPFHIVQRRHVPWHGIHDGIHHLRRTILCPGNLPRIGRWACWSLSMLVAEHADETCTTLPSFSSSFSFYFSLSP